MKCLRTILILSLLAGSNARAATPFDDAENAAMGRDQRHVRDLFVKAAESDPDAKKRDQARIRAARIDWYIFHDAASARTSLANVAASSAEASRAYAERAKLETELLHDFDAARKAADLAYAAGKTQSDRDEGLTRSAAASVEQARLQREGGKCPERERLVDAIAKLETAIKGSGPTVERTRWLLDAALLAHDDEAALQAWRWYYGDLPRSFPLRSATAVPPDWRLPPHVSLTKRRWCCPIHVWLLRFRRTWQFRTSSPTRRRCARGRASPFCGHGHVGRQGIHAGYRRGGCGTMAIAFLAGRATAVFAAGSDGRALEALRCRYLARRDRRHLESPLRASRRG
jgi:hypothetical protein